MAEDTSPTPTGLRSIWLLGGGAVLGVLTICALLSLITAVGVVWLTVGRANNAEQATQSAFEQATEIPGATNAPVSLGDTSVNPTALPPVSTLPSFPSLLILATPVGAPTPLPASAPDQAVRDYFQLVSQARYDVTWTMLTDGFKQRFNCCAPTYNYSGYVAWWDSVNIVEFGDVHTVSQSGNQAVVYAELFYVMNDGRRAAADTNPYIALVYDATTGQWRIDDKRATP